LRRATRSLIDSAQTSGQIDGQVQSLLATGAALYEVDAELVTELAPDLIVTQAQCDVCAVRYEDVADLVRSQPALRAARVLALNPLSLSEILADVERVAAFAQCAAAGRALKAELARRVDRVREKTAGMAMNERPRVVCLEWLAPLMAAGNWTPELIEIAGGQSGLARSGQHSGYVGHDDVLAFDPQVLILAPCGFDLARTLVEAGPLLADPAWGRTSAARDDRLYAVDGNAYLNRSGPRIVDSLELLAHLLHPALFEQPAWAAPLGGAEAPFQQLSAAGLKQSSGPPAPAPPSSGRES
jgi:iron complex transport system substrate-binding protein